MSLKFLTDTNSHTIVVNSIPEGIDCTFSYEGGMYNVFIYKINGCASWSASAVYLDYEVKKEIVKELKTKYNI